MNRIHGFYMHGGPTRKAERFASLVNSKSGQECRAIAAKSIRPSSPVGMAKSSSCGDTLRPMCTRSNSFFAQSLPCDSISWAASPTRVIVLQSSRRSAAPPIATPSSRNPVSPRPRFPTELWIPGKPSTSRCHSLASVARFRATTQLFRDVLAKNGPITLCISVA